MKYLMILVVICLTATISFAQLSDAKSYKYTVTFEKNTFEGENIRNVVRDFREHIFSLTEKKFDFCTRFDESGLMYFETAIPVDELHVAHFFENRNKEYLEFNIEMSQPRLYAFSAFSTSK